MTDVDITSEAARRQFKEPISRFTYITYVITSYALHFIFKGLNYALSLRDKLITPENAPDLIKTYACRPKLPIRIFYPKLLNSKVQKKLPAVLSIHGGAFVIGDPRDDDGFNYSFCNMHSVLVIALNYSKAPLVRFPTPTYDLEALILAVLSDSSLPIDHDRVALMGSSAGGNLALSVSILPSMNGSGDGVRRIKTVIPMYPVVDKSLRRDYKARMRRYKPSLGGTRAKAKSIFLGITPALDAAYTLPTQDLRDPLLSPIYALKDSLPPNIFFLGIELDRLAGETWRMVCDLTGRDAGNEAVGQEAVGAGGKLILDDERFSFVKKTQDENYRWLLVPDQVHAYDHYARLRMLNGDKEMWDDAEMKTREVQKEIGKWLFDGPFA
ncbi:triacylglycerol lipase [Fusarium beomiforme]|uniref:Triacylglycerol lipase n=1 Tax=Fusarium beomiforme TaxID=44412 RepID=A0A9P5ARE2_9HYPO|nr:triacylglycerol lipase [Fusarium beomiforme]